MFESPFIVVWASFKENEEEKNQKELERIDLSATNVTLIKKKKINLKVSF